MDVLDIDTYLFYRSVFTPVDSNMYVLLDGDEAIVIDSNVSEDVYKLFVDNHISKVHLLLTHEHYDHTCGVCWMQKHFKTILYSHKYSKDNLTTKRICNPRFVSILLAVIDMKDGGRRCDSFEENVNDFKLIPDILFSDGDIIQIAHHRIRVIHVPGHTLASCLFVLDEKIVFSGDSLIYGNKILTNFLGSNKEDILKITLPKLRALPPDIMIMPGHGRPFKKKEFNFDIYHV